MVSNARFHGRGNAQGLVDAKEIVVRMEQSQHLDVILELLTEGVRKPGEATHVHPHVEILPFDGGRADMGVSGGFLRSCPSRLSGLPSAPAALFIGHGFKAALAADTSALRPHVPHDLLDNGKLNGFRHGNGFQGRASGVLDGIESFCFASPLWHTSSVARFAAARQEVGI